MNTDNAPPFHRFHVLGDQWLSAPEGQVSWPVFARIPPDQCHIVLDSTAAEWAANDFETLRQAMCYMIPGDTVLLSLGANDVMNTEVGYPERSPGRSLIFAKRLEYCLHDIVSVLQEAGLRTALCVYSDHTLGNPSLSFSRLNDALRTRGTDTVELERLIKVPEFFKDIYPTSEGNEIIAHHVNKQFKLCYGMRYG